MFFLNVDSQFCFDDGLKQQMINFTWCETFQQEYITFVEGLRDEKKSVGGSTVVYCFRNLMFSWKSCQKGKIGYKDNRRKEKYH